MSQLTKAYQDIQKNPELILFYALNKNYKRPKFITKELFLEIPKVQDKQNLDEIKLYAHFFHPISSWDWYVSDLDCKTGDCFGFVKGLEREWGHFSLVELSKTIIRGIKIERDLYFSTTKFKDLNI